MASNASPPDLPFHSTSARQPMLRRLITALTILAWIAIVAVVLWAIFQVAGAIWLLVIAAVLAYVLYPPVQLLHRMLPRPLAILLIFLILLVVLYLLVQILIVSLIAEITTLIQSIEQVFSPNGLKQLGPVVNFFKQINITPNELLQAGSQISSIAQNLIGSFGTLLSSLLGVFLNLLLVTTLTVYFLVDGERAVTWLRHKTPRRYRTGMNFFIDTIHRTFGGYLRGQLILAIIMGILTGIVLSLLHVPYAVLLGVLMFILYFIPFIGAYISGILCILAALPEGWVITIVVFAFVFLLQQILVGQILSPRILGKAAGLHPIVAIFALVAGAELFGLLGGLFAVPVAGVLQAFLIELWKEWKAQHPEEFAPDEVVEVAPSSPHAELPGTEQPPT